MTRRRALAVAALALALVAGSCGGSDAASVTVPGVELSPLTTVATTLPAVAVTTTSTAVVSTTTVPAPTTTAAPTTTVRATTTTEAAPKPPCSLDLIVQQTETTYEGITPTDVRCADVWATWVGKPDDPMADGFFAVAKWDGDTWVLANLGSAEICGDGGVPEALWPALNCIE